MGKREEDQQAERLYEDSIATRYNKDYHEAPIMQWHSENFALFVKSLFRPGDRVLDLGCGSASLWSQWQKYLLNADQVVGVDLSPVMIAEAKRLFPTSDFRVANFFEIPAEAGAFDIVIVSSAFHHIADEYLPSALAEIHRVVDEHGMLIGREPLASGRLGDRSGWLSGALMNLRHMAYRLTHTREYPEPDPGPAHHAYNAEEFLDIINQVFNPSIIEFKHPVSPFLSRVRHPIVAKIAESLDESIRHREGQEVFYAATKNYASDADVIRCIRSALAENQIDDLTEFLAQVEAATRVIDSRLSVEKHHI